MGARICPRCSTRVDERRARTSPFCLSCGAPLGPSASSTFAGKAPGAAGGSSLPWIVGGIAAVVVLGFGAVVIVLVAAAGSADPEASATATTPTAAQPRVETADAATAASSSATKVASTAPTARAPRPIVPVVPVTVPTPPPTPVTAPPTATVTAIGPFPRAKAQTEVDRIGFGLASCKSSAGPFGLSTMRIDFEPDGRVGTVSRPPFAGSSVGTCISARFRTIKIGPFTGSTQSLEKSFIIQE